MYRRTELPFFLSIVGVVLGTSLGIVFFEVGQKMDFSAIVGSMGLLGAVTGFIAGTVWVKRGVPPAVDRFSLSAATAVLMIIALAFVSVGLLERKQFLTYTGLFAAVGCLIRSGLETSLRAILGFAGFAALSLFAVAESGDYSWLLVTALSVAGLFGIYLLRREGQHLRS
jgi:hypothetical protein